MALHVHTVCSHLPPPLTQACRVSAAQARTGHSGDASLAKSGGVIRPSRAENASRVAAHININGSSAYACMLKTLRSKVFNNVPRSSKSGTHRLRRSMHPPRPEPRPNHPSGAAAPQHAWRISPPPHTHRHPSTHPHPTPPTRMHIAPPSPPRLGSGSGCSAPAPRSARLQLQLRLGSGSSLGSGLCEGVCEGVGVGAGACVSARVACIGARRRPRSTSSRRQSKPRRSTRPPKGAASHAPGVNPDPAGAGRPLWPAG